ncbi:MAG: division/cell wall cluster transcriptional repressor MraZ [Clostridia bacterium]|nr:division/cell wall cluster transcriptional repressor MraZ [Clostridia bacterium]
MSTYFVDEYERQLDERGRIILPAKVREKMGSAVYITRSPAERCLHLYTEEEWESLSERMRALPVTYDKNAAAFVRMFFGTAASCEIDKQGRISVGKRLCEFAGLCKDIVLVGVNTRLEIWAKEEWDKYNSSVSETVILEGIEKFGLII